METVQTNESAAGESSLRQQVEDRRGDASVQGKPEKPKTKDRVSVPDEFFIYVGPAAKSGRSLYRCMKCPRGLSNNKTLSCSDVSRQNLYKHIEVRCTQDIIMKWKKKLIF